MPPKRMRRPSEMVRRNTKPQSELTPSKSSSATKLKWDDAFGAVVDDSSAQKAPDHTDSMLGGTLSSVNSSPIGALGPSFAGNHDSFTTAPYINPEDDGDEISYSDGTIKNAVRFENGTATIMVSVRVTNRRRLPPKVQTLVGQRELWKPRLMRVTVRAGENKVEVFRLKHPEKCDGAIAKDGLIHSVDLRSLDNIRRGSVQYRDALLFYSMRTDSRPHKDYCYGQLLLGLSFLKSGKPTASREKHDDDEMEVIDICFPRAYERDQWHQWFSNFITAHELRELQFGSDEDILDDETQEAFADPERALKAAAGAAGEASGVFDGPLKMTRDGEIAHANAPRIVEDPIFGEVVEMTHAASLDLKEQRSATIFGTMAADLTPGGLSPSKESRDKQKSPNSKDASPANKKKKEVEICLKRPDTGVNAFVDLFLSVDPLAKQAEVKKPAEASEGAQGPSLSRPPCTGKAQVLNSNTGSFEQKKVSAKRHGEVLLSAGIKQEAIDLTKALIRVEADWGRTFYLGFFQQPTAATSEANRDDTGNQQDPKAALREKLTAFYKKFAPEKIDLVPKALEKQMPEAELMTKLCERYAVDASEAEKWINAVGAPAGVDGFDRRPSLPPTNSSITNHSIVTLTNGSFSGGAFPRNEKRMEFKANSTDERNKWVEWFLFVKGVPQSESETYPNKEKEKKGTTAANDETSSVNQDSSPKMRSGPSSFHSPTLKRKSSTSSLQSGVSGGEETPHQQSIVITGSYGRHFGSAPQQKAQTVTFISSEPRWDTGTKDSKSEQEEEQLPPHLIASPIGKEANTTLADIPHVSIVGASEPKRPGPAVGTWAYAQYNYPDMLPTAKGAFALRFLQLEAPPSEDKNKSFSAGGRLLLLEGEDLLNVCVDSPLSAIAAIGGSSPLYGTAGFWIVLRIATHPAEVFIELHCVPSTSRDRGMCLHFLRAACPNAGCWWREPRTAFDEDEQQSQMEGAPKQIGLLPLPQNQLPTSTLSSTQLSAILDHVLQKKERKDPVGGRPTKKSGVIDDSKKGDSPTGMIMEPVQLDAVAEQRTAQVRKFVEQELRAEEEILASIGKSSSAPCVMCGTPNKRKALQCPVTGLIHAEAASLRAAHHRARSRHHSGSTAEDLDIYSLDCGLSLLERLPPRTVTVPAPPLLQYVNRIKRNQPLYVTPNTKTIQEQQTEYNGQVSALLTKLKAIAEKAREVQLKYASSPPIKVK